MSSKWGASTRRARSSWGWRFPRRGNTTGTYIVALTAINAVQPFRLGQNFIVVRVKGRDDQGAAMISIDRTVTYFRFTPPVRNLRLQ